MTKYERKIAKAKKFNCKLKSGGFAMIKGKNKQRYFHYTVFPHLSKIITSGILKRERSPAEGYEYIKQNYPWAKVSREDLNYIPVLWFSSNPTWENTVSKLQGSKYGISAHSDYYILLRFEINPNAVKLYGWEKYVLENKEHAPKLKRAAKPMKGNPNEWFYTPNDIPLHKDNFLSFGLYFPDAKAWIDYPFNIVSLQNLAESYQENISQAS